MANLALAEERGIQPTTGCGYSFLKHGRAEPSRTVSEPQIAGRAGPHPSHTTLFHPPAPPPNFVGRAAELRHIQAALQTGSASSVGLIGRAGVGKTALALALAGQLRGLYPDGQLLIDLPESEQPLTAAAIMGRVIHQFDPLARLPEDEAAAQAHYRRVLQGRRVLILVDNWPRGLPLSPLAPPAGCSLLVTATEALSLPGLLALRLTGLLPETAKQLLTKLAPRIGPDADKLAGLCWHMPLALHLVGGALAAQETVAPGDYALRLMSDQFRQAQVGTVDALQSALTLACGSLTPQQRSLWQQLAIFTGDFDRPACAALWALDQDVTERELGVLLRMGLVGFDPGSGRYQLHDLIRREAGKALGAGEAQAGRRRLAVHYASMLVRFDQLMDSTDNVITRCLNLLDLERGNILAGQAWAAQHRHLSPVIAKACSDYAAGGARILALRLTLPEQLAWYESAVQAARQMGDGQAERGHLANLGSVCRHLGQPGRSLKYYERYLQLAREVGDRLGEGSALEKLGLANAELRNTRQAIEYYQQSLKIARETGNQPDEARTSWNLGLAYDEIGELTAAIAAMQVCVDFERKIGHPNAEQDAAEVRALRGRPARHGHR